jgi:hypothetical protein
MSERNGWKAILTLLFLVQHKLLFTVLKLWHCGALNWKKKLMTKMIHWVWLQWINRDRTKIFKKTLIKQHHVSFYYQHVIKINDKDKRLRMMSIMKVCFKIILSLSPSPWPTNLFEAGNVNLFILVFCLLKKIHASVVYSRHMNRCNLSTYNLYLSYIKMSEENTGNTNTHWWVGKGLFVYINWECIPQPAIESLMCNKLKYMELFFSSN